MRASVCVCMYMRAVCTPSVKSLNALCSRFQELEKKRREERMRQKLWEQKYRLGSFRRRARLPGAVDTEATQMEEERDRDRARLGELSPLPPGLAGPGRRPSVGEFAVREATGRHASSALSLVSRL